MSDSDDRRTVRIPDYIWLPAKAKAKALGVPVSQVIRLLLRRWNGRNLE